MNNVCRALSKWFSASAIITFAAVGCLWTSSPAATKEDKTREAEIVSLRQAIDALRDSLQNELSGRWRAKQKQVEQREADKEELSRLKEIQERGYAELARVREECLSKENSAEEAMSALIAKQDEHRQSASSVDDVLAKDAESIVESFPLDFEQRRNDLESVRRGYQRNQDIAVAVDRFLEYKTKYLEQGSSLSLLQRTVLLDNNRSMLLTIARFGNAFAYGMSQAGEIYFVRQSGRLGADRFRIDKVESSMLRESLLRFFPAWSAAGSISGTIPTDVLQNEQTKTLASGEKMTEYRKFITSIKAGGAVMAPLLMLPIWAIILILIKLVQFSGKRGRFNKQYNKVTQFLDKNDIPAALVYVKSCTGPAARIFETCLSRPEAGRTATEKMVREVFIGEMPRLSSHLNTLAVIAGAAPLLGLLGTISGMINLFGAVTHYGTGDPKFLAGGISEALITAKTGLAIAIPALFIHDYLRNKKDRLQADIEKLSLRLLNRLWPGG
jgi:biopolymer transport protein ExbB